MSTSLESAMLELSKQLGDYWAGTTTSGTDSASVIDTALKAKGNDWITDDAYDRLTSGTYDEEERKITSLSNTTGDLTVLAHGGTVASGVTYEVHRLFQASEKRRALVYAAKRGFPDIHAEVRDESKTAGNWLRNGCAEIWTSTSYPDYWRVSAVTAAENTAAPYYTRGSSSCKLDTAAGYLYTTDTLVPEFRALKGKTVTFRAKVWCDTADCCRLGILYDGTNLTYSDYHPGTSKFSDEDGYDHLNSFLEVEKQIDDAPTSIEFRVYHAVTAGTTYVDDMRVTGPTRDKIYVGDLSLAQDQPYQVLQSSDAGIYDEPWALLHNWKLLPDNYLYIPHAISNYRLRILGINYLNFYDSSGDVGTDWDDTIAIDSPQLDILVAEAAVYLYTQMIIPNFTSAKNETFIRALAYWKGELKERQGRFGMMAPSATVHWS